MVTILSNIAVFSENREDARIKMIEMIRLSGEDVGSVRGNRIITLEHRYNNGFQLVFGKAYSYYSINEGLKGVRFNEVYIDNAIDMDIVNERILPLLRTLFDNDNGGETMKNYVRDNYIHWFD